MTAVVEAESLTKRFGEVSAVTDLSFALEAGTIVEHEAGPQPECLEGDGDEPAFDYPAFAVGHRVPEQRDHPVIRSQPQRSVRCGEFFGPAAREYASDCRQDTDPAVRPGTALWGGAGQMKRPQLRQPRYHR
jgi:hypothetical protein